jgi:Cu(I)/Ag(I) efflux system membrane protein CusA/SilA
MEGALLRLRPKVMTVSTVVAGLMPIMWSSSAGAEVMKPLAAPVLGGMVSSLLHVLVVTPVIFYWIHARHLPSDSENRRRVHPARRFGILAILGMVLVAFGWWAVRGPAGTPSRQVVHEEVAGDVTVRLLAESGREGLSQGTTRFAIDFRETGSDAPVDVRDVRVSAAMTMPGMVMSAPVRVEMAERGRVLATAEFSMSGVWRFTVAWTGPSGPRSVAFDGDVR